MVHSHFGPSPPPDQPSLPARLLVVSRPPLGAARRSSCVRSSRTCSTLVLRRRGSGSSGWRGARSMLQSLLPRWLDQLPAVDHGSQHSRPLCGSGLPEVRTARQEGAELRRVYPFWPGDQASQVSHTTFADTQTFAQAPCPRRGRGEADIGPSEGPNRGRMLVRDAASGAMQPLLQILSARSSSQTCARHRPQGAETEPGRQQAGDSDGRSATPVSGIADLAV